MNRLLHSRGYNFSLKKMILDSLYMHDKSSQSYRIINSSMHSGVEGVNPIVATPTQSTYSFTKLPSGITVLTQSICVPANVQLGVFIDIGTRDEDAQSSGSMLSLKNTYLKTAINTNETVNYGIAQMAGGRFEMEYNRENAFYTVDCLSHDVIDVFSMVADCAFEPKNFVSANVGANKNAQTHKLDTYMGGNEVFNDNIYSAAYGNSSLGMPLQGRRNNVSNLSAYVLQRFQRENITPERVVISATGIENHEEFVDLVQQKMYSTQLSSKKKDRNSSQYQGGQIRNLTESSNIHIALAFQGANHQNSVPLAIAKTILGNNRKVGRIHRNILNKHAFIDNVQAFSANYSDSGLFGIKIAGSAAHAQQILNVAAKELSELRNVSGPEIQAAKSALKGELLKYNTKNWRRLEERTKSLYYLGDTRENYRAAIDNCSSQEVINAINKALNSKITLVAQGGEVQRLPSYDSLSNVFK